MRGRRNNEIGNRYGKLLVLKDTNYNDAWGQAIWVCLCDCGIEINIRGRDLRKGNTKSCGCAQHYHEPTIKSTHLKEFSSWKSAKTRCTRPNTKNWADYGGRGISMCERWLNSFENFLEDMGCRPDGLSLDRINNDGNYEPSNCKWSNAKEQSNNQRRKRIEDFSDEILLKECNRRFVVK